MAKSKGKSLVVDVPIPSLTKLYQKWTKTLASTGEGLMEEVEANYANKMGGSEAFTNPTAATVTD
jgi:hypothetical protein